MRDRVTEDNMGRLLGKHVGAGDLLIDLAWNIDALRDPAVVPRPRRAVRQHLGRGLGSLRRRPERSTRPSKTLYWRHMNLRRMLAKLEEPRARRPSSSTAPTPA